MVRENAKWCKVVHLGWPFTIMRFRHPHPGEPSANKFPTKMVWVTITATWGPRHDTCFGMTTWYQGATKYSNFWLRTNLRLSMLWGPTTSASDACFIQAIPKLVFDCAQTMSCKINRQPNSPAISHVIHIFFTPVRQDFVSGILFHIAGLLQSQKKHGNKKKTNCME